MSKKTARKGKTVPRKPQRAKTSPKKRLAKSKATKKRAGRRAGLAATAVAAGLDLISAGEIVQAAIPNGPHDIDSTLEDVGLITPGERTVFRQDVVNSVERRGCTISESDVPNGATTTLRAVRTAVRDHAIPSGGS